MPQSNPTSVASRLLAGRNLSARVAGSDGTSASWGELVCGSVLSDGAADRLIELRGRSVLMATVDPFTTAAALVELDGVARRIVLYPPDLSMEHLAYVAGVAAVDLFVTDDETFESTDSRIERIHLKRRGITPRDIDRSTQIETEWILLTSGTTGAPKLVTHTLATLTGAIEAGTSSPTPVAWSTFYDIRRYGGLQIFLRAAITGTSLVLSGAQESTADFLARVSARGVTHISGTPSHWRRALMSPWAGRIEPQYVRLSGEIADQAILNQLKAQYPQAKIAHAFASTEAGVVFEVNDGRMGFSSEIIGRGESVETKVEAQTLRVRSNRTAVGYLGEDAEPMRDAEGFVDTGDALELRDGRYYFVGRRDGTINVGGMKVHPEEVEAVINRHPDVSISLVRTKKSPITGALVVADVVLKAPPKGVDSGVRALERDILQFCRAELAVHKVPAVVNFVPMLAMADSGKLMRRNA
jgi:acyl-coenzyme A synthetase/AMP-(fatty) acid ligase